MHWLVKNSMRQLYACLNRYTWGDKQNDIHNIVGTYLKLMQMTVAVCNRKSNLVLFRLLHLVTVCKVISLDFITLYLLACLFCLNAHFFLLLLLYFNKKIRLNVHGMVSFLSQIIPHHTNMYRIYKNVLLCSSNLVFVNN